MKAKIKWYQEVLELEPSSKVFFPLAKLFAENDQYPEAIATLKQGLERNTEHFEARMLLIDCLGRMAAMDARHRPAMEAEIRSIGDVLQRYPAFWQSWAGTLSAQPQSKDAAVALSFLSAAFADASISWTEIIEQGLRQVLMGEQGAAAASASPSMAPLKVVAPPPVPSHEEDDESDGGIVSATGPIPLVRGHVQRGSGEFSGADVEDEAEDEPFSLRTLSMAKVLAEQGDTRGALEICDELLASAQEPAERQRVEAFRHTVAASGRTAVPEHVTAENQPLQGKTKLINTLESLAERLEARAAR
ncbi:tetratricopeptide repeat protein [Desulfovibrio psychrotolerans]|uniref:Tetratricopeptide repeat protein n=1 Tax=Desulfovibrio psychrotolerans TaxID=415242 RepID=A0A7J0BQR4_9BACT|nr:tetratricopeptide repeat-containing protein [Desulfovibrio psychrotolerans]GFM35465.1 hypothetical protein DSM19430T_01490 [Desulfovibrio psychrotolerans]